MKFTETEIKEKNNIVIIEEENLKFIVDKITKEENLYLLKGDGYFKDELYKDFIVEVKLENEDKEIKEAIDVINSDWALYDFRFNF